MTKVSIIVPNYNHAPFLEQRLQSIFNQTFQDFELILLDDNSNDNSREILSQYATHPKTSHCIFNDKNSGSPFKQWAKGLALAKGEYVWVAESDDYSAPVFLEKLLQLMEAKKNVGITFCDSYWVDNHNTEGKDLSMFNNSFAISGEDAIRKYFMMGCIIQNVSATLIRKTALQKISQNYTSLKSCGDWLFYAEILLNSDLCYLNEKLNYFRWYHANISNNASKTGLWIIEGIGIVKEILKKLILSNFEKRRIIGTWLIKLKSLSMIRKDMKSFVNHNRLFLFAFSPFNFMIVIAKMLIPKNRQHEK